MKTIITGRRVTVKPSFEEKLRQKLGKLDKFFTEDAVAEVVLSEQRNRMKVEITVRADGMVFRAEQENEDALAAVDALEEVLVRQIRKNKTRLSRRLRTGFLEELPDEEEAAYQVVRTKTIPVKPLSVEEAILQMNLVGHQFFMFRNADTDEINVVYCRHDGGYGLLEPDR